MPVNEKLHTSLPQKSSTSVLTCIFHAHMGWTVSYERASSIFVLSWVLASLLTFGPLDLITSFHIFLSYALKKLPLNLEFYVKTKHSVLLFPHAIQFQSSPKFLCRNFILRSNIAHPSNHICIFLQFDCIFFN